MVGTRARIAVAAMGLEATKGKKEVHFAVGGCTAFR